MSKKVLIYTEEWAGSGHQMAALALEQALREKATDWQVDILHGLSVASPVMKLLSRAAYFASLHYAPTLWQRLYDQDQRWSKALKKPLGVVLSRRLLNKVIEQVNPDIVIATHAYCLPALVEMKRRYGQTFFLASVLTDYTVNSFWVNQSVDAYIVAHPLLGEQMARNYGIDQKRIFPNGIPVRAPFFQYKNWSKQQWKQALQLREDYFTVLLCGGEGGFGDFRSLLNHLRKIPEPIQIIIITGKNRNKFKECRDYLQQHPIHHHVHLFGFVTEIWKWIGAADVIITKPGGLTCSEALAMGTPLVLYQPLPGQEQRNSKFLQNQGAAIVINELEELVTLLNKWKNNPKEWQQAVFLSKQFGKPDAAYRTVDILLTLAGHK